MKVVLLAGGFGARISEESHLKPKPMIEIGGKPILWHIMKYYSEFGFHEFIICLGYKQYVVKEFFGEDVFSYVQGQTDSVPRKPDPSAALMIAEKLGCKKEECVYVGDSEVDIKTGHAAGMKTVSVSWGFRSREILKENGAEHIIDRPKELIHMIGKGI